MMTDVGRSAQHQCILNESIIFNRMTWKCESLGRGREGKEVVCGQVWWPILGICPLHLTIQVHTHSSEHTHLEQWAAILRRPGSSWGIGPCSRVSPQSWYWRWESTCYSLPPPTIPAGPGNRTGPLGYKSNSLTIRPRLPSVALTRVPAISSGGRVGAVMRSRRVQCK